MQSFLNKVAKTCIENYGDQLSELSIILPSKRAIVFLTEEFRKELQHGGWLPNFYSIEDFIQKIGDYHQLDAIELMFELYNTHQYIEDKYAESFEEFMNWGSTLLQDFNEIDRYLIDGEELFNFLTEAKAIEVWELEEGGLTEFQHQYLGFWKKLGQYYTHFKTTLNKKKHVYQGLGFRNVAESLPSITVQSKLLFAGFNALTEAEKKIIQYFELHHNAEVIWDADEYYLNDKFQEAGKFLREHKANNKGEFSWISDDLLTGKKEITVYGISGNIGQAKLVGNLLEGKTVQDTSIILSDEELLVPVLESLPQSVEKANVTMGYPLSLSPIFSWVESLIKLFQNNEKEGLIEHFYYKDLQLFLNHSISQHLHDNTVAAIQQSLIRLKKDKLIYVEQELLKNIESTLSFSCFLEKKIDSEKLIVLILNFINALKNDGEASLDNIGKECLFELEKAFTRLLTLLQHTPHNITIKSLVDLYRQLVSKQSISFVGEPLSGLQVMGVLESRTLDFKNVIITSVNEGILPAGKSHNSFIPFDIKRKYSLPSYQEKDAIFAYHFYRVLQRAESVAILYNTKMDQLQGGERSRFIEQLLHELPSKNPFINITHQTISPKGTPMLSEGRKIHLDDQIKEKLLTKLKEGLSPSALNTFINCPLDFYYKYVLSLKANEEVEEKIEDNTLGTIVHDSLEKLYLPYVGKKLDLTAISEIKKNVASAINSRFDYTLNVKPTFGNHRISYEVAYQFVSSLIKHDEIMIKSGHHIKIDAVEEQVSQTLTIELTDQYSIPVSIYGKVDRIDTFDGKKRIIDYKTGKVEYAELNYRDMNSLLSGSKSKAVQLMLYQLAYHLKGNREITTGIISLRNISNGFMSLKQESTDEDTISLLKDSIFKMLYAESYEHNIKSNYCQFCT